jgi:hypothetical protein
VEELKVIRANALFTLWDCLQQPFGIDFIDQYPNKNGFQFGNMRSFQQYNTVIKSCQKASFKLIPEVF